MRRGLPFQSKDGERCFDPAEVVHFFKWLGIHHGDIFWEERCIGTCRKLILEHHSLKSVEAMPPDPAALAPAQFSMTLSREFNLQACAPGARVRLRLPLPLEDEALRDLKFEWVSPPGIAVEFTAAPGRLDARLAVPQARNVTLGIRSSFTASPASSATQPVALTPSDIELYPRPSEGLMQVSPRIRALAAELAEGQREPRAAVRIFGISCSIG